MLLLVSKADGTLERYKHPNLGRLDVPRSWAKNPRSGLPFAADNDCFNGLDPYAYRRMVKGLPKGALFVTVPDVVGDHAATLRRWKVWEPLVSARHRPAFVLQDGCEQWQQVPDCPAVFIGGTTGYKLGDAAARLTREAKLRGIWVHMGRVNTRRRIRYAKSIGCDSIDGTGFSMFTDTHLAWGLRECAADTQTMLLEG